MRITIDEDKCCGAGQCVLAAPEVFAQRDDDGMVVVLDPTPPQDQSKAVKLAAQLCPALAIKLEE
jgi:ferredoxin